MLLQLSSAGLIISALLGSRVLFVGSLVLGVAAFLL
jgi:hypothetical protein